MSSTAVRSWLRLLHDIAEEVELQFSMQDVLELQQPPTPRHDWQELQIDLTNTNADPSRAPQLDTVRGRSRNDSVCSSSRESNGNDNDGNGDGDAMSLCCISDASDTESIFDMPDTPDLYPPVYSLLHEEAPIQDLLEDSLYVNSADSLGSSVFLEDSIMPEDPIFLTMFPAPDYLLDMRISDGSLAAYRFDSEPLLLNDVSTLSAQLSAAKHCRCGCRCN